MLIEVYSQGGCSIKVFRFTHSIFSQVCQEAEAEICIPVRNPSGGRGEFISTPHPPLFAGFQTFQLHKIINTKFDSKYFTLMRFHKVDIDVIVLCYCQS